MRRGQEGFTLIELVVVIVILGILAAVALPRFVDLTEDAEEAAFDGVKGSFSAGVSLAHSKALAQGKSGGSFQDITISGNNVTIDGTSGWPDSSQADLPDLILQTDPTDNGWTYATGDPVGTMTAPTGSSFDYDDSNGDITVN